MKLRLTAATLVLLASAPSVQSSSHFRRPFSAISKFFGSARGQSQCFTTPNHVTRGGDPTAGALATGEMAAMDSEMENEIAEEAPMSQRASLTFRDAALVKDIAMLTGILSNLVHQESSRVHDLYEEFAAMGKKRAADPNDLKNLQKMIEKAKQLSSTEALGVLRTINLALCLVNSAEVHHRLRSIKEHERTCLKDVTGSGMSDTARLPGPLYHSEDSVKGSLDALLTSDCNVTPEQLYHQLCTQKVEIVLTAHPTEVNRKSVLRKYRRVTELLAQLDRSDLLPHEKLRATTELQRIISGLWGMDEIRRTKPTVQKEAAGGVAIIETVLWHAVPSYLRKLDEQCLVSLGKRLPLDAAPVKFGSWIGGDRDGNPNVTPPVTEEVIWNQRLRATRLLLNDLNDLQSTLAISSAFTPEMNALADAVPNSPHEREKYRRVISHLRQRLVKTAHACEENLARFLKPEHMTLVKSKLGSMTMATGGEHDAIKPIFKAAELLDPLMIMHESLVETGFELVADGLLVDIIRRLQIFGLTLVPLDIREESTRHTQTLDAITRWLGIGSYKEWDEDARLSWLQSELASKRPLFRTRDIESLGFDADVVKALNVFLVASEMEPESLGAYVISQAQTASDVLAVMLLQSQFGMKESNGNMMRVVPLFETLDDLVNAPERLKTLFSISAYVGAVKGKQEVMVGYSDSAKDAGRLAACWAQYNSQEKMVQVAEQFGIELTFFHGKGGTVGRGGNPALYRAILSHPPNTINGRFRITEQGEMITQNFGNVDIAEKTLDIYTAAVMREAFTEHVQPPENWRKQMERVAEVSCADYRQLVRGEPRFVPYFRQATPELELRSLNIGSRPAKRSVTGGIESLRAIPWTFAWTQTRTHLSAWLGVGAGLSSQEPSDVATLQEMYEGWPWFRETVDLIAMIVSKTDFSISENYDNQLVDKDGEVDRLGKEVREKLVQTRQAVLTVTKSTDVAGVHVALQRASSLIRHPYVDPLNVIQAELLKRLRALDKRDDLSPEEEEDKQTLKDALIISINGIAAGMKNSG